MENILLNDKDLLVIHKPSGTSAEVMLGIMAAQIKVPITSLHIMNRLDQRVSGIMLFAKNKTSAAHIQKQMTNNTIVKKYKAIVAETPAEQSATLTHWLLKNNYKTSCFSKPTDNTKRAILQYTVAQKTERYCMLDITLQTGRFHQIRAQLASIGCPILGDLKYGYKRSSKDGSIFLQSYLLQFKHPTTLKDITFTLPMPNLWEQYGFE